MQSLQWLEAMAAMTNREKIEQLFDGDEIIFADGHDNAIVGFNDNGCVVYNQLRVIENLAESGMDHDDAIEFFDYNIAGDYLGEKTPVFIVLF